LEDLKRLYMKKWYYKLLRLKRMEDKASFARFLQEYHADTGDGKMPAIMGMVGHWGAFQLAQGLMQTYLGWQTRGIERYNRKMRLQTAESYS
jgi:hypothetical protein